MSEKDKTPAHALWNFSQELDSKSGELLLDPRFQAFSGTSVEDDLRHYHQEILKITGRMRDQAGEIYRQESNE